MEVVNDNYFSVCRTLVPGAALVAPTFVSRHETFLLH